MKNNKNIIIVIHCKINDYSIIGKYHNRQFTNTTIISLNNYLISCILSFVNRRIGRYVNMQLLPKKFWRDILTTRKIMGFSTVFDDF